MPTNTPHCITWRRDKIEHMLEDTTPGGARDIGCVAIAISHHITSSHITSHHRLELSKVLVQLRAQAERKLHLGEDIHAEASA